MKRNLYIKIAYWYYILGLTQDEIAKRLNFTRQKVNQMINSLQEMDIVQVTLRGYEQDNIELENKFEEKYNLKECLIVSDYGEENTALYKVANVASQYLNEVLRNGDVIGVSWGRTLSQVVEQMEYRQMTNCKVISLFGGLNTTQAIDKSDEVARNLANKLNCPSVVLYAPLFVEHKETKEWLMQENHMKQTFGLMNQCNVAVLGIGALTDETCIYNRGLISQETLQKIHDLGFVGDICTNLVRPDGSWNNNPLDGQLLSADMDCLKRIDNVIAVVPGLAKAEATKAALASGCIDTLIIDEMTARTIL